MKTIGKIVFALFACVVMASSCNNKRLDGIEQQVQDLNLKVDSLRTELVNYHRLQKMDLDMVNLHYDEVHLDLARTRQSIYNMERDVNNMSNRIDELNASLDAFD